MFLVDGSNCPIIPKLVMGLGLLVNFVLLRQQVASVLPP